MKKKKNSLDKYHYHEALDRTSMLCDILATQLMGHPVFIENKKLKDDLEIAIDKLYHVYTEIAKLSIENFEDY